MKGSIWIIVGVAAGFAIGIGKLVFFAGAAISFSDSAERVVGTVGLSLINWAAKDGAPRRVVEAITAVLAVLIPGITALVLMVAARATLRVRALIGLLLAAVA